MRLHVEFMDSCPACGFRNFKIEGSVWGETVSLRLMETVEPNVVVKCMRCGREVS